MTSRFKVWGRYLLGTGLALLFILPFYWAFVAALRPLGSPPLPSIQWWPDQVSWQNYLMIFEIIPMGRYTLNSLIVVLIAVPVTLITASMAGFAMAQLPNPMRQYLVVLSIVLLLIPVAAVWLFRFQILRWLGLLNTLWALVIPAFAASNPLFVLLYYWACRRIPAEIFEAARLDGAEAWLIWRRIVLPLTVPTSIGVIILTFVLYWSDFISPVLYIYDPAAYTLPVGLQILKQLDPTNWPLLMAAAVFMTLPVIVLFGILQRFFLHELSLTDLLERN